MTGSGRNKTPHVTQEGVKKKKDSVTKKQTEEGVLLKKKTVLYRTHTLSKGLI